MRFQDLLKRKNKEEITYSDLLQTQEWKNRRSEILKADKFYCTECGFSDSMREGDQFMTFNKNKFIDEYFQGSRIYVEIPFLLDNPIYLHVHHKHYVIGRLPWEYNDDELTTLCNKCHWELHEKVRIKVYEQTESGLKEIKNLTPCSRCNGAGVFPEYSHIQSGRCFKCEGARYEEYTERPNSLWFNI